MRNAWAAVIAIAGGCGGGSASCLLDDVLAADQGSAQVMDCGHLPLGASANMMTAAHDCGLAAAAAREPFILEWELRGIDSHVEHAFLALGHGGGWSVTAYMYDGSPGGSGGDNDPHTGYSGCASLDDLGACSDQPQSLCLACGNAFWGVRCP